VKQPSTNVSTDLLKKIKLIALDVDGVLTDGKVSLSSQKGEEKTFSYLDIMGLSLARKAGLYLALISGESGEILKQFSEKLLIEDVYGDCRDKLSVFQEVCTKYSVNSEEACFVGDDVNDLPALLASGFSCSVPNGHPDVIRQVTYITKCSGGEGAVREVIDMILRARETE